MSVPSRAVRLNNDTHLLKLIAIASMLVDHIGASLVSGSAMIHLFGAELSVYALMRGFGRLAFPLFAYCVAVGAIYTRNTMKYLGRLLLMGVISQPIYVLALHHEPSLQGLSFSAQPLAAGVLWFARSFNYMNIMFELALGLALIWSLKEKKYVITAFLAVLALLLDRYLSTSYGISGLMLMLLFYALIDRPLSAFVGAVVFIGWWGGFRCALPINGAEFSVHVGTQFWAILALPLICLRMDSGMKLNKWMFYLFYPAHLAAIYAVERFVYP